MSQHYIRFHHAPSNCEVCVQLGWDKPLQGFYMVALKLDMPELDDNDEGIVYSNLLDVGHPDTLQPFRDVSDRLAFPIPEVMWRNAYQDSQLSVVNKKFFYDLSGNQVPAFETN